MLGGELVDRARDALRARQGVSGHVQRRRLLRRGRRRGRCGGTGRRGLARHQRGAGPQAQREHHDSEAKGRSARITNFELGLEVGITAIIGAQAKLFSRGDLLLGGAGSAVELMRVSTDNNHLRLLSEGGQGTSLEGYAQGVVDAKVSTRFAVDVSLWGLGSANLFDLGTPQFDQPIHFRACDSAASSDDSFQAYSGDGAADVSAVFGAPASWLGLTGIVNDLLSILAGPIGCHVGSVSTSALVGNTAPSPSFPTNGHDVPDQLGHTTVTDAPAPIPSANTPNNLTVDQHASRKMCGSYSFKTVTVNGSINVGAPGETVQLTNDPTVPLRQCDGTLQIGADSVTIGHHARISADGVMPAGTGHPAGTGGGAGHVRGGGASGDGSTGGNPYAVPATGVVADTGSAGANGSVAGAGGGAGGGTIVISSRSSINLVGTVSADGVDGLGAALTPAGGACATGGGGGSGGHVVLAANVIMGNGSATVTGGKGGAGGFGGGGGSGGRLTINGVFSDAEGSLDGGAGYATASGATCDPGTDAHPQVPGAPVDGATIIGKLDGSRPPVLSRVVIAAGTLANAKLPGPVTSQVPQVTVEAVGLNPDAPVELTLCHKHAEFSNVDAFGSAIDPTWTKLADLKADALGHNPNQSPTCDTPFALDSGDLASDGHTFRKTLTPNNAHNYFPGVYGYYTYARIPTCPPDSDGTVYPNYGVKGGGAPICWRSVAQPPACDPTTGAGCHDGYLGKAPTFEDQPDAFLPHTAAKIGHDEEAPPIPAIDVDTSTGCMGLPCLGVSSATLTVHAVDAPLGSGIRSVRCRVTYRDSSIGITTGPWTDCSAKETKFENLHEGVNTVEVQVTDNAGNVTPATGASPVEVGWFVDTQAPDKPGVSVVFEDANGVVDVNGTNGWHHFAPTVKVPGSYDPHPSSGFQVDKADIYVDEGKADSCGTEYAASLGVASTICDTVSGIPSGGTHTITAVTTDRVGHSSPRSDPIVTQVDTEPPTSRIFVGAAHPDGGPKSAPADDRWYVTNPVVAFATSDGPGGSGWTAARTSTTSAPASTSRSTRSASRRRATGSTTRRRRSSSPTGPTPSRGTPSTLPGTRRPRSIPTGRSGSTRLRPASPIRSPTRLPTATTATTRRRRT